MTSRKTTLLKVIPLLAALTMMALLVGCSSSSSTSTPTVAISATGGTPQTVAAGAAFASLQATVTSNGSPSSGASVTFTAPSSGSSCTFSGGTATETDTTNSSGVASSSACTANSTAGAFSVSASTSGTTSTASFSLTITAASTSPLADGSYVYTVNGWDEDPNGASPYSVSGQVTISGGLITGGEQDYVDYFNYGIQDSINPTGSSILATADGNLQFILTTCNGSDCTTTDANLGVAGVETFNGTILPNNSGRALINEYDSYSSGSGEVDLQDPTAASTAPAAGYAFQISGVDTDGEPLAIGGVLNVDSAGGISGTGSVFDANDGFSGTTFQGEVIDASTVTGPDAMGRVVFTLNPDDSVDFPQTILVGYIIDSNRVALVETADSLVGTLGGIAHSQGASTGTYTSGSLSGSYVTALNGYDDNIFILQAASLLTTNAGALAGFMDFNDLSGSETVIPDPVTAAGFTVDPTGRVTISGLTDGTISVNLQLYLDGSGNALAITMDDSDALAGTTYLQSGSGTLTDATLTGNYGLDVTGWDGGLDGEFDGVGPVAATGTGDTLSGTSDINWLFSEQFPGEAFTGTYTASGTGNGLLTPGSITGLDLFSAFANTDAFDFYLIDAAGDGVAIETDINQLTLGTIAQQ